jgi:hypothetical protein
MLCAEDLLLLVAAQSQRSTPRAFVRCARESLSLSGESNQRPLRLRRRHDEAVSVPCASRSRRAGPNSHIHVFRHTGLSPAARCDARLPIRRKSPVQSTAKTRMRQRAEQKADYALLIRPTSFGTHLKNRSSGTKVVIHGHTPKKEVRHSLSMWLVSMCSGTRTSRAP